MGCSNSQEAKSAKSKATLEKPGKLKKPAAAPEKVEEVPDKQVAEE